MEFDCIAYSARRPGGRIEARSRFEGKGYAQDETGTNNTNTMQIQNKKKIRQIKTNI